MFHHRKVRGGGKCACYWVEEKLSGKEMLNSSHEIAKNKIRRLRQTESKREEKRDREHWSLTHLRFTKSQTKVVTALFF